MQVILDMPRGELVALIEGISEGIELFYARMITEEDERKVALMESFVRTLNRETK